MVGGQSTRGAEGFSKSGGMDGMDDMDEMDGMDRGRGGAAVGVGRWWARGGGWRVFFVHTVHTVHIVHSVPVPSKTPRGFAGSNWV